MDLEEAKKLMELSIKKAKDSMHAEPERKWLETSLNGYGGDDESEKDDLYMVVLFVLEGTPPKGYILADYSSGIVKVMSGSGDGVRTIRTYKTYKFGERLST